MNSAMFSHYSIRLGCLCAENRLVFEKFKSDPSWVGDLLDPEKNNPDSLPKTAGTEKKDQDRVKSEVSKDLSKLRVKVDAKKSHVEAQTKGKPSKPRKVIRLQEFDLSKPIPDDPGEFAVSDEAGAEPQPSMPPIPEIPSTASKVVDTVASAVVGTAHATPVHEPEQPQSASEPVKPGQTQPMEADKPTKPAAQPKEAQPKFDPKKTEAEEFTKSFNSLGTEKSKEIDDSFEKNNADLKYLKGGMTLSHWGKNEYDPNNEPWGGYSWSAWGKRAFDEYKAAFNAASEPKASQKEVTDALKKLENAPQAYRRLSKQIVEETNKRYASKIDSLIRSYDLPSGVSVNDLSLKKWGMDSKPVKDLKGKLPEDLQTLKPDTPVLDILRDLKLPALNLSFLNPWAGPEGLNEFFSKHFEKIPQRKFKVWDAGEGGNGVFQALKARGVGGELLSMAHITSEQEPALKKDLGLAENEDERIALAKVNYAILLRNLYMVDFERSSLRDSYKTDLDNALKSLDSAYGNIDTDPSKDKETIVMLLGSEDPG